MGGAEISSRVYIITAGFTAALLDTNRHRSRQGCIDTYSLMVSGIRASNRLFGDPTTGGFWAPDLSPGSTWPGGSRYESTTSAWRDVQAGETPPSDTGLRHRALWRRRPGERSSARPRRGGKRRCQVHQNGPKASNNQELHLPCGQ